MPIPNGEAFAGPVTFGLERHLHNFLFDNWDRIDLGREWQIYREPGNERAGAD